MELSELEPQEQLALVGLVKLIVHADQQLSEGESREIEALAAAIGREDWNARVREARERLSGTEAVLEAAAAVRRPEARLRIFAVLRELADADELVEEEARVLSWVEHTWFGTHDGVPVDAVGPDDPTDQVVRTGEAPRPATPLAADDDDGEMALPGED